jgi:c-di-GMP-binding flagellar brake protein YcgR
MENERPERRSEARYPIEARVIIHRNGGEGISAMAVNISGGGMLLLVEEAAALREGDRVTIEVELADHPGMPFSAWGVGRVVRADGCGYAVQLQGGTFDSENGLP